MGSKRYAEIHSGLGAKVEVEMRITPAAGWQIIIDQDGTAHHVPNHETLTAMIKDAERARATLTEVKGAMVAGHAPYWEKGGPLWARVTGDLDDMGIAQPKPREPFKDAWSGH